MEDKKREITDQEIEKVAGGYSEPDPDPYNNGPTLVEYVCKGCHAQYEKRPLICPKCGCAEFFHL